MYKFLSHIYWAKFKKNNFSQGNEEKIILDFFKNKKNGFYIDVGCHHPFRYSNTAMLYKLGWNGINIDPDKANIQLFHKYRERDININSFISDSMQSLKYHELNDKALNGSLSSERIEDLKKLGYNVLNVSNVNTTSLNQILKKHIPKINKIDFLDIDVEGHDFNVIKSINLEKVLIKLILVEVGDNEDKIDRHLQSFGYEQYLKEDRNKFYIKK